MASAPLALMIIVSVSPGAASMSRAPVVARTAVSVIWSVVCDDAVPGTGIIDASAKRPAAATVIIRRITAVHTGWASIRLIAVDSSKLGALHLICINLTGCSCPIRLNECPQLHTSSRCCSCVAGCCPSRVGKRVTEPKSTGPLLRMHSGPASIDSG